MEFTYHSNAIEGSTLSLRDSQLILEGREPNSGKSLREFYEARNHDRALRMCEEWASTHPAPEPFTYDFL
jgi:Fic family protein